VRGVDVAVGVSKRLKSNVEAYLSFPQRSSIADIQIVVVCFVVDIIVLVGNVVSNVMATSILKMDSVFSSETLVCDSVGSHNSEDRNMNPRSCQNLKLCLVVKELHVNTVACMPIVRQ
jgi:hypothetical protein